MKKSSLAFLLSLSLAPAVGAQDVTVISPDSVFVPGARIRLSAPWAPARIIVGTVEEARVDSIVVDTADVFAQRRLFNPVPVLVDGVRRVTVPIRNVTRVDVSMGRSRMMGALKGATLGALLVGGYVGLTSLNGNSSARFGEFASGFAQGAVVGFAVGGPVGWTFTAERWRPVAIQRGALPDRDFAGRR